MPAAPAAADPVRPAAAPPGLKVEQPWHAPPLVRVPLSRRHEVRDALAAAGFETWESGADLADLLPTWEATLVFTRWEVDQDAAQRVLDELARN